MLKPLGLPKAESVNARFLPDVLAPLVSAAEHSDRWDSAVASVIRVLGFDSFMYGTSLVPRPGCEHQSYVFTTLSPDWVRRYDQRAYIECDPRILHTFNSAMPLVWDQSSSRGRSATVDAFLDDAAAHGVASGVVMAVHCAGEGHVVVAYNSRKPCIDEVRRFEISRNLGDLVLLSIYFHELFMKHVIARGAAPSFRGSPLSAQERRCLVYAAHGFTGRQIAEELHISERMVELHFSHGRSKLGVVNRHEAIAKVVADGTVRLGEIVRPCDVAILSNGTKSLPYTTRRR